MKIKTIEDVKKLFNEGRLTHIILSSQCSVSYSGKQLKINNVDVYNDIIIFEGYSNRSLYLYFRYVDLEATEKLIKGEKTMTKSDLKDGMVVKLRNEDKRLVLCGKLLALKGYDNISSYTDDLKNKNDSNYDIIKVYNNHAYNIDEIFKSLSLIWERKSEAEIKLDSIEKQIEELQKCAKELRKELKK